MLVKPICVKSNRSSILRLDFLSKRLTAGFKFQLFKSGTQMPYLFNRLLIKSNQFSEEDYFKNVGFRFHEGENWTAMRNSLGAELEKTMELSG